MEHNAKQNKSDLNNNDTVQPQFEKLELDGLFARVSPRTLQAKLVRGGDLYSRLRSL